MKGCLVVSGKLEALRPYGEEFQNWKSSGDEEWLLRGDQLKDAVDWAFERNRKLDPEDYKFLKMSQDLEVKDDKLKIQELIQQVEDAVSERITHTYNVQNINADKNLRNVIQRIEEKNESNYEKIGLEQKMMRSLIIFSIIVTTSTAILTLLRIIDLVRFPPIFTPPSAPVSK